MKSDKIDISYTKAAEAIKVAILNAQYEAAKGVNNIQLMLYYAIGRFISQNTRKQKWGTNAVATISHLLKQDMPGLRGYSESNIKRMRTFYEEWRELDNSPIQTGELLKQMYLGELNGYLRLLDNYVRKPHENPSIGIILCKDADRTYVEYMIQDYDKPMGVATYKTATDMPERLRNSLPDQETLLRLMENNTD